MVMVKPGLRRLLARVRPSPASVNTEQCVSERVRAVLCIVTNKGASPLSSKEAEYCNEACIVRLLKAKGNHVNKAAKQLRATLAWRANLDVDYLTADEFSAELAQGIAYVPGHDEFSRPVLIVRLTSESLSNSSQKQFLRYVVFCMEVAIGCIPPAAEQCVLIIDASGLKKGAPGMSAVVQILKVLGEHYPERIARTFIVDPPPIFYLLLKGIGKFVDLKTREKLKFIFSRDYSYFRLSSSAAPRATKASTRSQRSYADRSWSGADEQQSDLEEENARNDSAIADLHKISTCPPTSNASKSHNQTPTSSSGAKITTLASLLSSSSFSLVASSSVSVSLPSSSALSKTLMPSTSPSSTLQLSSMSSSSLLPMFNRPTSGGAALPCDKNQARSHSFATVAVRKEDTTEFRSFRADTRARRIREEGSSRRWTDLTFGFNKKEETSSGHTDTAQKDKNYALFMPYYSEFLSKPYNEAAYRAHMKPPLAGLISILGRDMKLRQPSFSLHTCTAVEAMLHHLHLD